VTKPWQFQPGAPATQAAASKGGHSAVANRRARVPLNLFRVEAELPRLDSVEGAMARLDRIGIWACSGLLTGMVAAAAVRSVEVWLKGHESRQTDAVTERLRTELEQLKVQLRRPRLGGGA
jgi:hypothetical protein